jgi:membrane protein implicated in regulation of membrane protease activity
MTGGQIASLIFGLILLLPGGCFLFFGGGMLFDGGEYSSVGPPLLLIAFLILGVATLCLWIAFRRRNPGTVGEEGRTAADTKNER